MSAPSVSIQVSEGSDEAGPERIQMDIARKLLEVGFLLAHDGLVAVLEEVADTLVPPVEGDGIPGQPAAHEYGQSWWAATKE
jgi:hypothetical protein